jgi:hypothetical protein
MTQYLINGSAGLLARAPDVFSGTAPGGGVPDLKTMIKVLRIGDEGGPDIE